MVEQIIPFCVQVHSVYTAYIQHKQARWGDHPSKIISAKKRRNKTDSTAAGEPSRLEKFLTEKWTPFVISHRRKFLAFFFCLIYLLYHGGYKETNSTMIS
eukprot:m.1250462 g.1250462  ORF g.1250462 m.1250462 type:complete len:100 (+) comp24702_c0_seq47:1078-1377(+)